jgi:hypothetical protein
VKETRTSINQAKNRTIYATSKLSLHPVLRWFVAVMRHNTVTKGFDIFGELLTGHLHFEEKHSLCNSLDFFFFVEEDKKKNRNIHTLLHALLDKCILLFVVTQALIINFSLHFKRS